MSDEFDVMFEEAVEEDQRQPTYVLYEEPVDDSRYAAIIHDSFGERYVDVEALRTAYALVTILRVLGVMNLRADGEVQFILNSNLVPSDHQLVAGDVLYITGKLAGG